MTVTDAAQTRGHLAKLLGRESLYMILYATQLVFAALCTPLITRVLGVGQYGTVTAAIAIHQVVFVFAGLSLQSAVQREYAAHRNPLGARQLTATALLVAAAVTALGWSTAPWWSGPLGLAADLGPVRLGVLWAGAAAATAVTLALLRSQDRLGAFVSVTFFQSVVLNVASLAAIHFYHPSAEVFLWSAVGAQGTAALTGILLARPAVAGWWRRDLLDRALRFALPLVPAEMSTFLLNTSDRLIIGAQLSAEAVARYQVAYNVASMPMLLLSILNTAWMPRFFGIADETERRTAVAAGRDALYRLMVPVLAGFAFGAPLVAHLWAPASYHTEQLSFVMALVLLAAVPFTAQLAVVQALTAQGRTVVTAAATIAAAVLNVLLNLLFVPIWGLAGAAGATLIAYASLFLILILFSRRLAIPPTPARIRLQLTGGVALTLGVAALPETPATLALRWIGGAAALIWFLLVLRALRRETA
ncbi:hypothetical protein GCM10010168_30790 [Actinoplanes ianthinogenes]|uniref:Polysaccharide biosynthesis protein C-terminal domain-containing protein n=1 Tax=Actinoplanes ianthinogenes TaxID=122358 RepID=A0ABM7LLP1_9ACTN|nr:oligosaccharide flippase family protein [Actinoplanes ianthinogenes]BCJ40221.1 hypothetical protein Aiant_08780 [Actinoplanes ianthinogenes]GGR11062.1 hypothetical protein GCM10010168_30790 [Actinoplanes ianthinogenes]